MSDRVYTEEEVRALLERAAELQAQTARQAGDRPGLTLEELQTIASDAGLDPALLRRAAAELDEPGRSLLESSTGTSATHVFVERWVPGPLVPETWEDMVAELRHRFDTDLGRMMGMPGYGVSSTEQIGRTVEWKHTSLSGVETRVMVRERDGGTRIRLSQRVGWASATAESATYGALLAFFGGMLGIPVTESLGGGVAAFLAVLLVAFPLILMADRAWRRKKHRELEELGDRLAALAEASGPFETREEAHEAEARASRLEGSASSGGRVRER